MDTTTNRIASLRAEWDRCVSATNRAVLACNEGETRGTATAECEASYCVQVEQEAQARYVSAVESYRRLMAFRASRKVA